MKIFTLTFCLFFLTATQLICQIDFYGRRLTGQSPNSVSTYILLGVTNGTSVVSNASNVNDFDHVTRQLNLFNLGIGYASQILDNDDLEEIQINLDTMIGGTSQKNAFRFHAGLQYEAWDRDIRTLAIIGSSRFGEGGLSVALQHEMSLLPEDRAFQLIPATARDQSLFANIYAGVEAGFDTGFGLSLEESGIFRLTTDHLVRDVADGKLTFDEYKDLEYGLHQSLRYQAPKNIGGSEWYFLATLRARIYIKPFNSIPIQLALGLEGGLDVGRFRKRNQNRIGFFLGLEYLLF